MRPVIAFLVLAALGWSQIIILPKKKAAPSGGPVAFANATEIIDTDANNSITVTVPTNLASGDTWVIYCAVDADSGGTYGTLSGFTAIGNQWNGAAGYSIQRAWYKVAGASESNATVTITGTDYDSVCYSIRLTGANATTPLDATGTPSTPNDTNNTIDAPDITIAANNSLALLFFASDTSGTATEPSGTTPGDSRLSAYPTAAFAYQSVNAGSYSPSTWSTGAYVPNNKAVQTISFKP